MSQRRIMIVDDSVIMRRVISEFLKTQDNVDVVAQAKDGKDALGQLKSCAPELILLDLEMPNMSGLEFLRHAKLRSDAKILVLSSVAGLGSSQAQEAIKLGANGIVSKPSGAVSMSLDNDCGRNIIKAIEQIFSQASF